jgi:hypothetical protein
MVMSVDIRGWTANDTTYFVQLVERTAEHFRVREVTAATACLSRKNLNVVEMAGAMPFIPFKSNALQQFAEELTCRKANRFL